MKKCHVCEALVPKKTEFCLYCGAPLYYRRRQWIWLISIVVASLLILFPIVLHFYYERVTAPAAVMQPICDSIAKGDAMSFQTYFSLDEPIEQTKVRLQRWQTEEGETFQSDCMQAAYRAYDMNEPKTVWDAHGRPIFKITKIPYNTFYDTIQIEYIAPDGTSSLFSPN